MSTLDARGGRALRIPNFDLREPGAEWDGDGRFEMVHERGDDGVAAYRLVIQDTSSETWTDWSMGARNTLQLLPNRSYVVSALINVDFERPAEVNMGLKSIDGGGAQVVWNLNGIPNRTDGWERWEWEFTTDPRATHGVFQTLFMGFPLTAKLRIADLAFVELPTKALKPYAKGEGATFRGGPGALPMRIEEASASGDTVVVRTTGARYTFDLAEDTVLAEQLLEREREVASWRSSLSLKGLEILRHTDTECVLANDRVTFGVQCDSLVMVVPHGELILTCESKIGGRWNRMAAGHLIARDDVGGFAANPDIPFGSGRMARVHFGRHYAGINPGRLEKGGVDFAGMVANQDFLSRAEPGWQVSYYLSPGERLGISVFPPRPFPWRESFESRFTIAHRGISPEIYKEWAKYGDVLILWNWTMRSWSFSWGREHIPYDLDDFRAHVRAARDAGMTPIMYASCHWYYSRDADEYAAELRRMKDLVDIEGVYYDGIPGQEWVVAYEEMRMTREIFRDGKIIVHATGNNYNGHPPLLEPSIKIPAVETYSDATYTGELVNGEGRDWAYPKYIAAQYRLSNCIGVMKYDKWEGLTPLQRDLMMLIHNGRACLLPVEWEGMTDEGRLGYLRETYLPILDELRRLWEEKGSEPDFYEKHYLPRAIELTRGLLPE